MYLIYRWKQNKVQLKIQKLVEKTWYQQGGQTKCETELARSMATARRAWRALRKLHRRPGNRAEISGDGAVKTATTSRFQERLRQSRLA